MEKKTLTKSSALSGGNFWQGAIIGGIVAGLNHSMHKMMDFSDPKPKKSAIYKALRARLAKNNKPLSTDCLNRKDNATYSDHMTINTVGGFLSDFGDGITVTGYALTATVVGSEIGIPLAGVGNIVSTAGALMQFGDAYAKNDNITMGRIVGFKLLDRGTGSLASKYKGFESVGSAIFQQNIGLKVWLLEKGFESQYPPKK